MCGKGSGQRAAGEERGGGGSSCRGGNKSETNAIAEWAREKSKARGGKEA